jgi:hypothetical protein
VKPEFVIAAAILAAASEGHSHRMYDLIDSFKSVLETIQEEMPNCKEVPHVCPS